ncbi:radical SAM enzyme [Athelia psychrophila]|uniref:Radical SAM enzyme n=1 Tax=Athelia psychrophila TaxID=1759441 RepID=A0A166N7M1_9AGAM|nr:radical SAM enzyme [Fibularhizoctonia sp. CBS 109695]
MDWIRATVPSVVKLYDLRRADKPLAVVPLSVNYFPHRVCNYSCNFCFHTSKTLSILPIDEAKEGLRLLAVAGMQKMNISGGEPFLQAAFIGELFRYCKEELHIESCSVVCNGSKVTEKWLDEFGRYLDFMAISCDSFDPDVNFVHGRGDGGKAGEHVGRVFEVADWCRKRGVKVKLNSVITRHNWQEDMNEAIEELAPARWKVFQVLLLDGENTGAQTGSLRDGRDLTITDAQFQAFLERHKGQPSLVPENNKAMKDSYLLLDEEMKFLNCQTGIKVAGRSLLKVGVEEAMKDAGFDNDVFLERGGVYDWGKDPEHKGPDASLEW